MQVKKDRKPGWLLREMRTEWITESAALNALKDLPNYRDLSQGILAGAICQPDVSNESLHLGP